ncbi:MAG: alanine racemase [Solirubrobacteraceae bacterium]|nr:alanine racemase [Solirubrobacteraceae bacterium]
MDARTRLDTATAHLDPPLALVDLDAFDANAADLERRAGGTPLRVASKSVRVHDLLTRVLERPGWDGVLAYALEEALWLHAEGVSDDIVIGYPTADRGAIERLATDEAAAAAVTLMVDDLAQLDLIDSVRPPAARAPIRVCLELDAAYRPAGRAIHIGTRRSPVHGAAALGELAQLVAGRQGFILDGVMAYEGQIAGLGDRPPGARVRGAMIRTMQRRSAEELAERRAAAVAAVAAVAPLRFVNGGGTGSVHLTATEAAVTEVAAGSGLFGPTLFDAYAAWRPRPAALFALPVVRRPTRRIATLFSGGYIASGPPGWDRVPAVHLPAGLKLLSAEGAGEVQTPVRGRAARGLRVGDRVWLRHAKAGELCERFTDVHLLAGTALTGAAATYRGEGRSFG